MLFHRFPQHKNYHYYSWLPTKIKPENVNNGFRSDATASDIIISEDKQTFLHSISKIFLYSSASFLFLLF